jgi:predicted O-methyltransferase YrrM
MKLEWRDVPIGASVINTSLTADETAELQRLAAGGDVLEIGSAFGYSTVALGLVAESVVAIDPHITHASHLALVSNLEANGLSPKVAVWIGRSDELLPVLFGTNRRFDLVWIDGDHTAEMVTHDVQWARKLLRPTGTLACHDFGEETCPGVAVALNAWKSPPKLVDTLAVYGPGEW